MQFIYATNNSAKLARIKKLLKGTDIECLSLADAGIQAVEIDEGSDLFTNARDKAQVYRDKTDLPILGSDSAFVIPGSDLDPAKVKRNALHGKSEHEMTQEQIAHAMIAFYKKFVEDNGGNVEAYWEDVFVLIHPDGSIEEERAQRPVILTSEIHGDVNPFFPIRLLYIVKATGKYVAEQSEEDEQLELAPVKEALLRIFK